MDFHRAYSRASLLSLCIRIQTKELPAPLTLHSDTEEGARAPSESLLALHPDTHEGSPLLINLNPDTEQAILPSSSYRRPSHLFSRLLICSATMSGIILRSVYAPGMRRVLSRLIWAETTNALLPKSILFLITGIRIANGDGTLTLTRRGFCPLIWKQRRLSEGGYSRKILDWQAMRRPSKTR
jgi:hypothetical protein